MIRLLTCAALALLTTVGAAEETESPEATLQVGDQAPDVTLTGIDGKPFKLSEIIGSGKHVALIFSRAHW